jgi:hypothetical protein
VVLASARSLLASLYHLGPACRRLSSRIRSPTHSLLSGPCLSAPLPVATTAHLCLCLTGLACQLFPPSSNLWSTCPPWPRPCPRKSRPLPTRPTTTQTPLPSALPFPPLVNTSQPAFARALPLPRARRTAVVHRTHTYVLPPPLRPCRAHCLGEFCLGVHNSRHASICPLPLWFSLSVLTGAFPAQA